MTDYCEFLLMLMFKFIVIQFDFMNCILHACSQGSVFVSFI